MIRRATDYPGDWRNQLDSYLSLLESQNKMMGSVAIAESGHLSYSRALGYSDVVNKIPATTSTKYRIGSITKTFTAVMVLQLIEENKLSLETSLASFYPQIPHAEKITMRHLLSHSSGLFNMTDDPWHETVLTEFRTKEENIAVIKSYAPVFEPGEKAQYCNSGYVLLGYIMEDVTGKDYNASLQERICNKIGLTKTYFGGKINPDNQECFSYFAKADPGWELAPQASASISHGAGAIVSTPEEVALFMHALFHGYLVNNSALAEMLKFNDGEGMGMKRLPYVNDCYGHPGGNPGFLSVGGYLPHKNVAFAVCTNGLNLLDEVGGEATLHGVQPPPPGEFSVSGFYQVAPLMMQKLVGGILDIYLKQNKQTETEVFKLPPLQEENDEARVHFRVFDSSAAQTMVSYHIYLPKIYEVEQERNFPVLYWLHGGGPGAGIGKIQWLANHFDSAIRGGKIPPMLVVFPYGRDLSMWIDAKDGTVPMETVVIKELLPHIDATFRTIADREGRLIEGFSMGGYGAARLGFKYHNLFGAVSILGAGPMQKELIVTPRMSAEEREALLQDTYGGDMDFFIAVSPRKQAEENAAALQQNISIRQVVGEMDETFKDNYEFHQFLTQLNIAHAFVALPGVPHSPVQLFTSLGEDNWSFYQQIFGKGVDNS